MRAVVRFQLNSEMKANLVFRCAELGYFQLLLWANEGAGCYWDNQTFYIWVDKSRWFLHHRDVARGLEELELLKEKGCPVKKNFESYNCHPEITRWLLEQGSWLNTNHLIDMEKDGHLELLRWIESTDWVRIGWGAKDGEVRKVQLWFSGTKPGLTTKRSPGNEPRADQNQSYLKEAIEANETPTNIILKLTSMGDVEAIDAYYASLDEPITLPSTFYKEPLQQGNIPLIEWGLEHNIPLDLTDAKFSLNVTNTLRWLANRGYRDLSMTTSMTSDVVFFFQ